MSVQVKPISPGLPPTTGIQDPAVRRAVQAMQDVIHALRSDEGAVEIMSRAAAAMTLVGEGTPSSVTNWLFSSEVYQRLTRSIEFIDIAAKQGLIDEAVARQGAIDQINAALADIQGTPEYNGATTYAAGDLVTYTGALYRALVETTGNLPTNLTYWEKIGNYASLGDAVAAHAISLGEHDTRITTNGNNLVAEASARDSLAVQLRGNYAGTDVGQLSQGLIFSERETRASADGVLTSNLNALTSRTTTAEGAIVTEQSTRANNDSAIVQAVNTAWAITGATNALVQNGTAIETNWTTAEANQWGQLQVEVFGTGGNTIRAALTEEVNLRADLSNKVGATWTVRADVNGYVAGIGLGVEGGPGGTTSQFVVNVDKFAMVTPGQSPRTPFVVDGGVVYIDAAMISKIIQSNNYIAGSAGWRINKDGTAEFRNVTVRGDVEASSLKANTAMINTGHIQDLSVTTLKIGPNAVTIPVTYTTAASFTGWSTGYAEIGNIYVNPEGGTVILMCSANWQLTNAAWVWIRIRHSSGAIVAETRSVGVLTGYSGGGDSNPIYEGTAMALGTRAEAGTYYMDIRAATTPSGSLVTNRTLVGIGAKK